MEEFFFKFLRKFRNIQRKLEENLQKILVKSGGNFRKKNLEENSGINKEKFEKNLNEILIKFKEKISIIWRKL